MDWTPARDDPQTITFTMPDCNVTVTALCQGGNDDIDNPSGGGSSDVVTGIAAVALTGAAAWGIYEAGTGIYRVLNMPGVPMPSNRAGLATLIWEKAGCRAVSSSLFSWLSSSSLEYSPSTFPHTFL